MGFTWTVWAHGSGALTESLSKWLCNVFIKWLTNAACCPADGCSKSAFQLLGFSLIQVIDTGLKNKCILASGTQFYWMCSRLMRIQLCVCVCVTSPQGYRRPNYKELATDQARYQRWLLKHECKAFYTPVFAEDLKQGTQYLLQVGYLLKQLSPQH